MDRFDKIDKRVIRDIRHYELRPDEYTGKFDGIPGNVYKGSFEIKCIGQRIARKLNELKFITGDFDHLYIYLNDKLEDGTIIERDFEYDKQMKCFDFGQNVNEFNKYKVLSSLLRLVTVDKYVFKSQPLQIAKRYAAFKI